MSSERDVVVKRVLVDEGCKAESWGRDTLEVAKEFCHSPKWPARTTDHFIGVDDWGSGTIVCATRDLSNWIGKTFAQFVREAH